MVSEELNLPAAEAEEEALTVVVEDLILAEEVEEVVLSEAAVVEEVLPLEVEEVEAVQKEEEVVVEAQMAAVAVAEVQNYLSS